MWVSVCKCVCANVGVCVQVRLCANVGVCVQVLLLTRCNSLLSLDRLLSLYVRADLQ